MEGIGGYKRTKGKLESFFIGVTESTEPLTVNLVYGDKNVLTKLNQTNKGLYFKFNNIRYYAYDINGEFLF